MLQISLFFELYVSHFLTTRNFHIDIHPYPRQTGWRFGRRWWVGVYFLETDTLGPPWQRGRTKKTDRPYNRQGHTLKQPIKSWKRRSRTEKNYHTLLSPKTRLRRYWEESLIGYVPTEGVLFSSSRTGPRYWQRKGHVFVVPRLV